jgi:lysylphosphatidylglycerol synthetase-like protein (DUF2156 family)
MQLEYAKVLLAGAWVLAMGVLGYFTTSSSATSWAVLVVLTVIPIAAMWRFWNVPRQTMSESINEARR